MTDLVDRAAIISYQISRLGSTNGHHKFEDICYQLARAEVSSNLVPATGPVSAGGDQGRDFETYRGTVGTEDIVFACTIQKDDLKAKITADVEKITAVGENVDAVVAMFSGEFPVGQRHGFSKLIRQQFGVRLELLDRQWMADKLAEDKNFWIAERYLDIPAALGPAAVADHAVQWSGGGSDLETQLGMLPHPAVEILIAETAHRSTAERIAAGIVRGDPEVVLRTWFIVRPDWVRGAPAAFLAVFGHLAQSYGLHEEAATWFEQAGADGYEPGRSFVRAALQALSVGAIDRAMALLEVARQVDDGPLVTAMIAWVASDWDTIFATIDDGFAITDTLATNPYLAALQQTGQHDRLITFLRQYIAQYEHHAGVALILSRLLSARSAQSESADRQHDQAEALKLAVRARDLRRAWRGDSVEAVRTACTAAIMAGNLAEVIKLGTLAPDGVALEHEAADRDVQSCVAQAALGTGDMATAVRIASSASGFQQALIRGDILQVSSASRDEIDAQFIEAWQLVEDEDDKVQFWLSASGAGVDPLPGADELAARDDDLALLCGASSLLARDQWDDAIALLRPVRNVEKARQLLAQAYRAAGRIDDAVAELMDMARRFSNVDHALKVVELLVGADRIADAAVPAAATLPQVRLGRPERNFLHEVGVAAASNRGDWVEMERLVTAWIGENGPTRRRRWFQAMAITNQADGDRAWRTLQQGGPCEVERPLEAELWIGLHRRFAPGIDTLREALRLAKRFPDDAAVRASATSAFLFGGDEREQLTADEITQWQAMVQERAANQDPNDTFVSISVPDDIDGLIESLRPMLEPQAQRIEEMLVQVRRFAWPQGMLAMAAGRPYTKTLVQRAAGFLAVASPDQAIVSVEIEAAIGALQSGHIVVDVSAPVTGWYLQDIWSQLANAFVTVGVTPDSKMDAASSSDAGHPRSTEVIGWDNALGRPVLHEISTEDLDRIEAHVGWVIEQIAGFSIRPAPAAVQDGNRGGLPWMSAIASAQEGDLPLWSDDAGVRGVAREHGVAAFGTDALLFALQTSGKLSDQQVESAIGSMRDECCIDFQFDPRWTLTTAARTKWGPGPAMLAMGRPATWRDVPTAYLLWQQIVIAAGRSDVALVPAWIFTATTALGLAVVDPEVGFRLAASLLLQGAAATDGDPAAFAACASAAGQAAESVGMPDPTELGLMIINAATAEAHGPQAALEAVALLGSALTGEHQEALERVLSR